MDQLLLGPTEDSENAPRIYVALLYSKINYTDFILALIISLDYYRSDTLPTNLVNVVLIRLALVHVLFRLAYAYRHGKHKYNCSSRSHPYSADLCNISKQR